jgi:alpha-L-rhamnosidase
VRLTNRARRRLGITDPAPALSWSWPPHEAPTSYQVQLSDDPGFTRVWADTGPQPQRDVWVPWPGAPLRSRQLAYWRVRTLTASGWGEWAQDHLEAGLLDASDWQARPLGLAGDFSPDSPMPVPRFATTFELDRPIVTARLYLSALGMVEAEVNGRSVSDDVLGPGWNAYRHRLAYDTYDVTHLLRVGTNELSADVGDGWYRGRLGWEGGRCTYGEQTAVIAQLEVMHEGGSRTVVASGQGTWKATTTPVRSSDLYDGCDIDLTADATLLEPAVLDMSLPVRFARQGPPVRRTQVLPGRRLEGEVYDFGQNLVGWLRIHVRAAETATVTARHAEVLQSGQLATAPLRTAKATDTWRLPAGEHVLEPRFTFHGFRFAELVTDAEVLSVQAVVVGSDLARTGDFRCSDDRLNRLHENVVWSQRANFLSVPTDCPQRDERLGWTGDAQVFAATAGLLHDCGGFFADWLGDLRLEQHVDGRVPVVIPDVLGPAEAGIAGWSDAAVIVPWQAAVRSGDLQILRDALPSMRRWIDWVMGQAGDGLWLAALQLGDWLDPDAPPDEPRKAKTDADFVANAVVAHSSQVLADAHAALGEDGHTYAVFAERLRRQAWIRWGRHAVTSQTGCALALRYGLVPADQRQAVEAALGRLVRDNGGRIGTGFLGTAEVLYALSDSGLHTEAYQLLLCEDCPSWLYSLAQDATTMWERWDALRSDGSLNLGVGPGDEGAGMLSFNHYAYGSVAAWMHEVIAGLRVRELPEPTLDLTPTPGGGVRWAKAELVTPRGPAEVAWELADDWLLVEACVPSGYDARITVPPGYQGEDARLPTGRSSWRFACLVSPS